MKNKYSLLLLVTSFGIISCQEKVEPIENEKTVVEDNVIVYEEYMGDEPTTPEETEFYEPKVAVVKPGSIGAAPSDAIVLFNGATIR